MDQAPSDSGHLTRVVMLSSAEAEAESMLVHQGVYGRHKQERMSEQHPGNP